MVRRRKSEPKPKKCKTKGCLRPGDYQDGICRECYERDASRNIRNAIFDNERLRSATTKMRANRKQQESARSGMSKWKKKITLEIHIRKQMEGDV